jgi:Polysaccharide pyruvyl transferase
VFDERSLKRVNTAEALIVGGGGLFLPDASPNGNSGWQWNIADGMLRRIDVPLVVFGVGYSMFEGQQFSGFSGGRFRHSLRTLVERSAFVGLRNHGSVNRVRDLLPGHLAERVRWQPCPTTITRLIRDDIDLRALENDPDESPAVLLNCAYDRAGRRFGNGYGRFLSQLRDWVLSTRERAPVRYVAHSVDDEKLVADLRREHGLTLPVIAMYDLTAAEVRAVYRRAQLVVGMHGYAAMIPFGCGTPIISLISHPELAYFLDDIDRSDWGIPIQDPLLGGRLRELTADLLDSRAEVVADIGRIQQRLHQVTTRNVRSLPSALQPGGRIGQDAKGE